MKPFLIRQRAMRFPVLVAVLALSSVALAQNEDLTAPPMVPADQPVAPPNGTQPTPYPTNPQQPAQPQQQPYPQQGNAYSQGGYQGGYAQPQYAQPQYGGQAYPNYPGYNRAPANGGYYDGN